MSLKAEISKKKKEILKYYVLDDNGISDGVKVYYAFPEEMDEDIGAAVGHEVRTALPHIPMPYGGRYEISKAYSEIKGVKNIDDFVAMLRDRLPSITDEVTLEDTLFIIAAMEAAGSVEITSEGIAYPTMTAGKKALKAGVDAIFAHRFPELAKREEEDLPEWQVKALAAGWTPPKAL